MVQEIAQSIIRMASNAEAQDIYFVPRSSDYQLFLRVGDERRFIETYQQEQMVAVVSHFKFMAGMNVGERRRSQLGSCDYSLGDKVLSLRLSTVGDYRGYESLVIRLLHNEDRELRFWFDQLQELEEKVSKRGLYLFAGPVGSGKTTLMHALAKKKFSGQQVMSIEDPVEIKQEEMLQLQLNEAIGMTYDSLIKLSLRHRPDLLLIGEIRDTETARAVIRASLTGVTVFSTIHAKSIPGVYERLLELGVSEEELRIVLQGICYQRLIKGGGVTDFAIQDYQNHSSQKWNQQMDALYEAGHIELDQAQAEKLSIAKQEHVIELFHNLYSSGFHLSEVIDFLRRSQLVEANFVERMQAGLANGKPLSAILSDLGFSDQVTTQLALAEQHGNVTLSLEKIRSYLENLTQVRKKLVEVATYPVLLLGFLILIMLGLKNYLLPQLESQNGATRLISVFPQYVLLGSVVLTIGVLMLLFLGRRAKRLALVSSLARLPFLRPFLQDYLTAFYAREWGSMIAQGLELNQIFPVMQGQRSRLFREIGQDLERALARGRSFSDHIQTYPFFKRELALMIEYGEAKSKLGSELEIYADKTWAGFFHRLNKAMNVVQPLVFVFVALMIVLLYAAMLLPIYENLEVPL